MRFVMVGLLVVAAGCGGRVREGLPCSEQGNCPDGQQCVSDICTSMPGIDAAIDTTDAGNDASLCSTGSPAGVARASGATLEFFLDSEGGPTRIGHGASGDIPIVGDWDGDGFDEVGVVRDGAMALEFYLGPGSSPVLFGLAGDTPIVGDWDGDGITDIGSVRPQDATLRWGLNVPLPGGGGFSEETTLYGANTDIPITGDWDGNGITNIGVSRDNEGGLLHILSTNGTSETSRVSIGDSTIDVPVVHDWTGDGLDDVGVSRGDNGRRFLYREAGSVISVPFGDSTDIPVAGTWAAEQGCPGPP